MQYAERFDYVIPDPLIIGKIDEELKTFEPLEYHSNFSASQKLTCVSSAERNQGTYDILTFMNDNFSEMLKNASFANTSFRTIQNIPENARLTAVNFNKADGQGELHNSQINDKIVQKLTEGR